MQEYVNDASRIPVKAGQDIEAKANDHNIDSVGETYENRT